MPVFEKPVAPATLASVKAKLSDFQHGNGRTSVGSVLTELVSWLEEKFPNDAVPQLASASPTASPSVVSEGAAQKAAPQEQQADGPEAA